MLKEWESARERRADAPRSAEFVRAHNLTVRGDTTKWSTASDGRREVQRFFCPVCGS